MRARARARPLTTWPSRRPSSARRGLWCIPCGACDPVFLALLDAQPRVLGVRAQALAHQVEPAHRRPVERASADSDSRRPFSRNYTSPAFKHIQWRLKFVVGVIVVSCLGLTCGPATWGRSGTRSYPAAAAQSHPATPHGHDKGPSDMVKTRAAAKGHEAPQHGRGRQGLSTTYRVTPSRESALCPRTPAHNPDRSCIHDRVIHTSQSTDTVHCPAYHSKRRRATHARTTLVNECRWSSTLCHPRAHCT